MPIFQGTAKNKFASFTNTEDSGKLTEILTKSLASASALLGGSKQFADSFVEDGSVDVPGLQTNDARYTNLKKPSRRSQFTQRPTATVLVKKKQFSALRTNYETRYLDDLEKLYLRCIKTLLKRKCDEIAFYESLINFNSIYENEGFLNIDRLADATTEGFLGLLIDTLGLSGVGSILSTFAADAVSFNGGLAGLPSAERESLARNLDFLGDIYRLKQKNDMSKSSAYTRWVEAPNVPDYTGLGTGTGTIELNLISSLTTRTTVGGGTGSATLSIEDPYQLMLITDNDIEIAVRNVTATTNGLTGFFSPNASAKLELSRTLDTRLNESRSARKEPVISFYFDEGRPVFEIDGVDQIPADINAAAIPSPFDAISEVEFSRYKDIGLSSEDIGIVNQILKLLRDYSSDMLLSVDIFSNMNSQTADLRKRMRRDFLGQHLLQPVDQVSVFINSHTDDVTPRGGASSALAGKVDQALTAERDSISMDLIEQERRDLAPSIPLAIYGALRNRKIYRSDGNCVFTGLIQSVSDSYDASGGRFSLSVQCEDTASYLRMGRFTFKPSLNNTFGLVHDPVTPFKLNVDPVTGLVDGSNSLVLIDQNLTRMPYLSVMHGPNAGKKLTDESALISDKEEAFVLNHTPGLVYQWKEGIITATPITPGPEILRGLSNTKIGGQFGGFSVVDSPFAGMDAANIASILICGQPYNYTTFLQTVRTSGGFSTDSSNGTRHFFNALFDSTNRMARFYGDFVPAKDSSLSRDSLVAAAEITKTIEGLNASVQKLLSKRAQKQTEFLAISKNAPDSAALIQSQINAIEAAINQISTQITASIRAVPPGIDVSIEGNAVLFSSEDERRTTDIQLEYRLRRKPEDVRLNIDNNYFVVSSKYDSSAIIQAFSAAIASQKYDLYNAEYKTPYDIITDACTALSLEFFSDNNGNIVLRPPQYNRIPLSLMLDIIRSRGDGGRSILPPFIANLAVDRAENIKEQILDNELQLARSLYSIAKYNIRIDGSANQITPMIKKDQSGTLYVLRTDALTRELEVLNELERGSSRRTSTFGPADRLSLITSAERTVQAPLGESTTNLQADLQAVILNQYLRQGKALSENLRTEAAADAEEALSKLKSPTAALTINTAVTKIGTLYSQRSSLIRSLSSILDRYSEAAASPGTASLAALATSFSPMLSANLLMGGDSLNSDAFSISPLLRDIVEDDINNIEGPGSAGRFIINDDRILSVDMSHSPPTFNQVVVKGAINFLTGADDGQIAGIPQIVAEATDFDSWRQYGLRGTQTLKRPDFTSADQQCAPYAVAALLRNRQSIHQGSVSVIGNEWYKAGDNVYLSHRGMVYYVEEVSHSISLNDGSFTTGLSLSFGRPLGEYVPTPTDLAGTVLLKNTSKLNQYRTKRSPVSTQSTVIQLGTANFSNYDALRAAARDNITSGGSSRIMNQLMADVDSAIRSAVARSIAKFKISSGEGRIEVRAYYASTVDVPPSSSGEIFFGTKSVADEIVKTVKNRFSEIASEVQLSAGWSGINTESAPSAEGTTSPQVAVSAKTYDISVDLDEEGRKVLAIPSEEAWLNPVNLQIGGGLFSSGESVQLPINAVDIVYIVNKNRGNTKGKA